MANGWISRYIDVSLPFWCGNKPGSRPERFEEVLTQHEAWTRGECDGIPFWTIGQVASHYDEAIQALVNERELEGEGMRKPKPGRRVRPNEAWKLMIGRVRRKSVPAELIQMAFANRRRLTVRHGEIAVTFAARKYHYRIPNRLELMRLNGMEVELAYDPLDLGDAAVYYESRFVGLVACAELRKMGEDEFRRG